MAKTLRLKLVALASVTALFAAGCGGGVGGGAEAGDALSGYDLEGAEIAVGSKDFTEQQVLGQITVQALEAAGATVNDQVGLAGTDAARQALLSGEIDTYWEYTGTGWINHLGETEPIPDEQEQYEVVRDRDLEENDIRWFAPAPFNNTYALAHRSEASEEVPSMEGIENLSDLEQLISENPDDATLCVESEFNTRDDGLPGMEEAYGYEFPEDNVSLVDTAVVYTETDQGNCNFGSVFTTDGRIVALDLTVLEDDQAFFPIYNPSMNVRGEIAEEYPDLEGIGADLAAALDNETMQELNASVDVDGESFDQVAEDWLTENNFIQ